MLKPINDITQSLPNRLAALYGERMRACLIFGSHARRSPQDGSDLDVLIVLDRVDNYAAEVDRTSEIVGSLSLEHGISISRVFVSEVEWREGQSVFLQNVRREAVPL